MTVLGAALLASGIFYVINNPNLFMSSILSLQEQQFIKEKWRDVAYKTNDGFVDIFVAEHVEAGQKIDFSLLYNPETIEIDPNNIQWQWTRTYTHNEQWIIVIHAVLGEQIKYEESLLLLPFTGDNKDILLGEVNSKNKWLSIWSLNERTTHLQ